MKRVLWIGGAIIGAIAVIAVGVGIYVLTSLDSLVETAIETEGSRATQSQVSVGAVDVDLFSGQGSLTDIAVANPPGFSAPTALRIGSTTFVIDLRTAAQDPIVISRVVIDQPTVTYEVGPNDSNLDVLRRNVEAYTGHRRSGDAGGTGTGQTETGDDAPAAGSPAPQGGPAASGPRVVIDDLYIRGGTVNLAAAELPGSKLSAPLTDIHLQDLGRDSGGATPQQLAEAIVGAILAQAQDAAAGAGVGGVLDGVREMLRDPDAGERLQQLFQ